MFSFIVGPIVGVVLFRLNYPRATKGDLAWVICLGACVGLVVGSIASVVIGAWMPFHWKEQGTWPLANMRTSEGTSGIFLSGTGSFRDETYYRVLIVNENGTVSPFSVRTSVTNTQVREDEALVHAGSMKQWVWQANPASVLYYWGTLAESRQCYFYEFTVPKGSVHHEFIVE